MQELALGPYPHTLVACEAGHVTDPLADIDTSTGKYVRVNKYGGYECEDGTPGYVARSYVETARYGWFRICRHPVHRGGSTYRCQRTIVLKLEDHPAMEAAFRIGGLDAIQTEWLALVKGATR